MAKDAFDGSFFSKGGGSSSSYTNQKRKEYEAWKQQLADQASVAGDLKKSADSKKTAEKSSGGKNILQKVGGFIKDQAVDLKDTTVGAVKNTVTTVKNLDTTSKMKANSEAMAKNTKEWGDYMRTLPVGDAKWQDPAVQEKLREFKYKAHLLSGQPVNADDMPTSAKGPVVKPGAPQESAFKIDPKTGKLALNNTDPYKQYRDLAITKQDRDNAADFQKVDHKKYAAQAAETFLNVATLGFGTGAVQGGKVALKTGIKAGVTQAAKVGVREGAEAAVGTTAKELAKHAGKDALVGGAYGVTQTLRNDQDNKAGLDDYSKNILLGASIGAAAPVVGRVAKPLVAGGRKLDQKVGQVVADKLTDHAAEDSAMRFALQKIGDRGVVGTLDDAVSHAGRTVGYKIEDAARGTAAGSKALDMRDRFMTKYVTSMHGVYSVLKRYDHENGTNSYAAAREVVGNANRALSYANDFVENNQHSQQLSAAIAADAHKASPAKPDLVAARQRFDEYAKVRSEKDLIDADKKAYGKGKIAEVERRLAAFGDNKMDDHYDMLVNMYRDLNDFRLENGLMSKEQHEFYKNQPFDYVRVQRELPQWMLDKPGGRSGGSKPSVTDGGVSQKRNKYASAEQLSPLETMLKTVQDAHVKAYNNKAGRALYDLLDEAGEVKLRRSTDVVREKQAMIQQMSANKPMISKMQKMVRSKTKSLNQLQNDIFRINKQAMNIRLKDQTDRSLPDFTPGGLGGAVPTSQAGQVVREATDDQTDLLKQLMAAEKRNPDSAKTKGLKQDVIVEQAGVNAETTASKMGRRDTVTFLNNLVTADPAQLKKLRAMIESREAKHSPLFDTVEVMNRDLHDMYAEQNGLWQAASGLKTNPDKSKMTSFSFLDDGVENVVQTDPAIAAAIHDWGKQQTSVMNNVLRLSNNIFKYGTTGANAGFALPNFVADWGSSAINSKNAAYTHSPSNFVHALAMTIGKPLTAEDARILEGYRRGNKGQLSINQYEKRATADKAASEFVKQNADRTAKMYTVVRHPKQALRTLIDLTEGSVGLTENLTRIANKRGEYRRLVKKGADDASADRLSNIAARENSIDFLEMGDYGRLINSVIPYFNATIQASRTLARNASERPVSFAGKTAALVGVPIAATTIWNTSDPKRNEIYKTIPEYVKDTNFVVVTPGAKWNADKKKWDGVVLMKKPQGVKEFAEPIRRFLEYKAEHGNDFAGFLKENGGDIATDFVTAFEPIDFTDPNKFLSSVTPQILKPTAEAILNKSFFQGTSIVPDSLSGLPADDQKFDNYSKLTTIIGHQLHTSPLRVDAWIKGTFGEVGTNAQHYTDKLLLQAGPEATGGRSLPESVTRRFNGAQGGADTDAFYKSYTPAYSARTAANDKVTALVKAGRINEAKRRAEEYNATVPRRFEDFIGTYKDSPNYDEKWDEKIDKLMISTSGRSFKARRKSDD